jgi:S-adenosylmethionine/arginine decarboxylase-like enzyme
VKVVALNVTAKTITVQLWSTANGTFPNYGVSDVSAYTTGSTFTQPAQDILNSAFARTQYEISQTTGELQPVSGTP